MKHPCNCEICIADRYWSPCDGCKDGHASFWKTVVESPEWKAWEKEQKKRQNQVFIGNDKLLFDYDQSRECGWISPEHFKAFISFIKSL